MRHEISFHFSDAKELTANSETAEKSDEQNNNSNAALPANMGFCEGSPPVTRQPITKYRTDASGTSSRTDSLSNRWHANVNLNATDLNIDCASRCRALIRGTGNDKAHLEKFLLCHETVRTNEEVNEKESISLSERSSVAGVSAGGAANLKFGCGTHPREWTEVGRTMGMRVYVMVLGLLLLGLATCAAAPAHRPADGDAHSDAKYVKNYLERFGYLRKGRPEIANLLHGDSVQELEDDFRIAIKTLQEFGGIEVTGEIDEATKELLTKKRCGRPDREVDFEDVHRRKRFAVQGEKWKHTNLSWSLSSSRPPSQLDPYGTRQVLARALDVWEQASRLTFTEVNADDADIVVSFAKRDHGDLYPFDGRGAILAHAFFPGTGRGGDAHFDDDELWLLQPNNDEEEGTSLFAVAAHEFGHSLGLSHSSVKGALMYPWYQGIKPNFVLPEDDRNGIQQMYGPKEKKMWARIPTYRPVEPPPTTTTTSTTTTTTTTRRPYHHHNHHHDHHHNHDWPHRNPYTPVRPPYRYFPDRRYYNTTEEHPRRTHPYPRPTPETTPRPVYYPRYPTFKPDYPNHKPNIPKHDYPKKKPYYPEKATPKPTPTPPSDKPDTCDTSYDAVSLIRGELFIFKNRYHWRIGARGRYDAYPIEISRMWSGLPKDMTHVDAVYERPDKKIAFFIGKELYLFDSQYLMRGYPKPLVELGLPESLEKIDAAMVWGHNGKTYFYSGNMYWKFDEDEGRVELDYPRDMSMWKGVGYNIDSVFQWKDGKTYFFKGKGYWKFNDLQMRVEHERQMPSAPFWMGCPTERAGRRAPFRALPALPTLRSPSSQHMHLANIQAVLSSLILVFLFQIKV